MAFFTETLSEPEIKERYRILVKKFHPDRGGNVEIMKRINYEYARALNKIKFIPPSLHDVRVGCKVFVNRTPCVVTLVEKDRFKARSLQTNREAFFSKSDGYAMLNFNFRASVKVF